MNDVAAQLIATLGAASRQDQFLDVVSREEAEARFRAHLVLRPLGEELVPLAGARMRVLARDVLATVDVPGFDRASVDGFAVRAADTAGASEAAPCVLHLTPDLLTPGVAPAAVVEPGWASVIATGGMIPRGADAVLMVEHTEALAGEPLRIAVHRPAAAGAFVAGAGSDIALGETVLRRGRVLSSREIAMLAAVGLAAVPVWRRPVVAILSTGDEIVPPGGPIGPGQVFDSNGATLAASVEEQGGVPLPLGIIPDDPALLEAALADALRRADIVLLSGGTSKGAGDLASRAAAGLRNPGIVVHGVALKPGKPLCLAVQDGIPVAILPGFPTSAIFTFHSFIAPVIRIFAGLPPAREQFVQATLPLRIGSERGRTEYVLSALVPAPDGGLAAYPTAKGSGAVTSFAAADGFFAVPAATESVAAGTVVRVQRIGEAATADLVIIGSHCTGLDLLIGVLEQEGLSVRSLAVGSQGGLNAVARGACDLAGIHLMDPATGEYNRPLLPPGVALVPGYGRLQGVVVRADDERFAGCRTAAEVAGIEDDTVLMVNRNAGSGTRVLIDRLLQGRRPAGFAHAPKSHNAVAAAVAQGRADWGVAIDTVAREYGLRFLPLQAEQYDFAIPEARLLRAPVQRFLALLAGTGLAGRAAGEGISAVIVAPDLSDASLTREVAGIDQTGARVVTRVPMERPLTLFLNGQEIVTAMTIGDHPRDLAVGYFLNQGMLRPDDVITAIDHDAELAVVVVRTERQTDFEQKLKKKTQTSGCAQGTAFGDLMDVIEGVTLPAGELRTSWLYTLTHVINTTPSLYLEAGAIHGAVLCEQDRPLLFMEDVGRHNAVDKIAGTMHRLGLSAADKLFYTTGRLTSEMVIKTVRMGIPILISRSGFTAWGVELAQAAGLTLIGRARGHRFIALSGADRIVFDADPAAAAGDGQRRKAAG